MPTQSVAVTTAIEDSELAGRDLGNQLREGLAGERPDAVVVFASSRFEYTQLLAGLDETCRPRLLAGASSAGEFIRGQRGEGTACALGVRSNDLGFAVGLGLAVSQDRQRAAHEVIASFEGVDGSRFRHRTALVMTDALAGHADELVEQLTLATSGRYQFAGGGAGDDARFARTHVFSGTKAFTDAVVALEILSDRPLGIGVSHGWTPASSGYRVTEAQGARVVSLNGMPVLEVFEDHARATGQSFDRADPLPFFLHNILGIDTGAAHRLRVPLSVNEDGSVTCAAEIPTGATVFVMKTTAETAVAAATNATRAAVHGLHGAAPGAALFFDCVATRLRMGDDFGFELDSVAEALGDAKMVGCNTYGQIARAEGQFGGFHNCTAVVLVLPA
jgi:hypothetical protein